MSREDISERLRTIRTSRGLTQARFAEALDLPIGTLRGYEQGQRDLPAHLYFQLEALYGVNPSWLHSGEGEQRSRWAERQDPLNLPTPSEVRETHAAVSHAINLATNALEESISKDLQQMLTLLVGAIVLQGPRHALATLAGATTGLGLALDLRDASKH